VHEVASIRSMAEAAQWARSALPAKNTLTASDARLLEVAFELRLSALEEGARDPLAATPQTAAQAAPSSDPPGRRSGGSGIPSHGRVAVGRHRAKPTGIDKSVL